MIIRTIDFQLSKETGHTEILQGASDCLDELRREFTGVCQMLPELRDSVVRGLPRAAVEHVHHCTIMPQLGFLIAVRLDTDTREGAYHGQHNPEDEWIMCFASEDMAYYKNQLMLDLDSQYGDLPSRIAGKFYEYIKYSLTKSGN
jgi:DNA mismatch repair protein MSH5